MEKRQFERYSVQEGAIALIGNPMTMMGSIIDVSRGGLSFQYLTNHNTPNSFTELGILISGKAFYLDKIKYETVSDTEMLDGGVGDLFPLRRCGVKFEQLTGEQKDKLDQFINSHGSEEFSTIQ